MKDEQTKNYNEQWSMASEQLQRTIKDGRWTIEDEQWMIDDFIFKLISDLIYAYIYDMMIRFRFFIQL